MKRSRINQVIRETEELLARHQIFLPLFWVDPRGMGGEGAGVPGNQR